MSLRLKTFSKCERSCGSYSLAYALFFYFVFLLFPSYASSVEQHLWKVEVTKDKEQLTFGDTLAVTIRCEYPASYTPNVFEFLLRMQAIQQYGFFNLLQSSHTESPSPSPAHLVIQLKLQPRRAGTLIFTPGILSFTPVQKTGVTQTLLVPAFSLECKLHYPSPHIAPLLPLHPETQVTLSVENRKALFEEPAVLEKEQKRNRILSSRHSFAWMLLILIFLGIGGSIVILWFFKDTDIKREKPLTPTPVRNLNREFIDLERSSDAPHLRLAKLSKLLREAVSATEQKSFQGLSSRELLLVIEGSQKYNAREKELLKNIFLQLDVFEFSQEKITEDEWAAMNVPDLSSIFSSEEIRKY